MEYTIAELVAYIQKHGHAAEESALGQYIIATSPGDAPERVEPTLSAVREWLGY